MTSYQTGHKWMQEILSMNENRCKIMFRMEKETFFQLSHDLENIYELKSSRRMSVIEKVGIFVFILAQGASNRHAQERFQHSGETISRVFHEVLRSVCSFARELIKPDDPEFKKTASHYLMIRGICLILRYKFFSQLLQHSPLITPMIIL